MGIWSATPDRPILAVTGDGVFAQYMAELCGTFGIRVMEKNELDAAIKQAFEHNGLAIVEIITDPLLK
jgi:thiamine pyrophosphate-dependent acetolactate synthase large subunit-like protein